MTPRRRIRKKTTIEELEQQIEALSVVIWNMASRLSELERTDLEQQEDARRRLRYGRHFDQN